MKRKILLQLVLPLLGLIALFSMLAFAPNSAQRHPALLEMSVILREADSSILSTTRQGMEQAAADLNVELRFLSPTADNSAEEQIQLLQREVEAGASAILLIPADRTSMADAVSAAAAKSSLVTLETDMTAQGARGCISWLPVDTAEISAAVPNIPTTCRSTAPYMVWSSSASSTGIANFSRAGRMGPCVKSCFFSIATSQRRAKKKPDKISRRHLASYPALRLRPQALR